MEVERDKLSRVRKLLNLAISNPESYESKSAIQKVKTLLSKYNLTIDDMLTGIPRSKQKLLPAPKEKSKFSFKVFVKGLIEVKEDEKVILQIVPDSSVIHGRKVESILNTFHSIYESFMDRFWNENYKLVYKTKDYISYRILYKPNRIQFFLVVPRSHMQAVLNSVANVWSKCAIIENDYNEIFDPKNTACAYLELKEHFFKATLVNYEEQSPISSLMSAGRNLMDGDKAMVEVAFVPVGKRWQRQAREARSRDRMGKEVKRKPTNLTEIGLLIGDFFADVVIEKILEVFDLMLGNDDKPSHSQYDRYDRYDRYDSRMPSYGDTQIQKLTNKKDSHHGFDAVIRIVSQSESKQRANMTLRAIGTSFKDVSADNEFEIKDVPRTKGFINRLEHYRPPLLRINGNILSIPECCQLLQLPSADIQDKYQEIERIENMEIDADKRVLDGGIELGEITVKRKTKKVFMPVKDWNDFCRTMIVMGGQGQGKTEGFLANLLIQAYLNGFGALAIDSAKKEISTQIKYAVDLGIVKQEDFVHIDASKVRMSLDWQEALLDEEDGMSRLASTAISFFKIERDTTGQTGRFLRALIMCMRTGKLIELIDFIEDMDYLKQASTKLSSLNKRTIEQYIKSSPDKRAQLAAPIYNRLDSIMGDNYLMKCLESKQSINMVDIMSQKKIFVFDFSDEDLLPSQQDTLINLLFSKIDLAMRLRKKVKGAEFEFPFFIAGDEPAKYLKSADIWEAMTVQGRKWRISCVWAFHFFNQVPKGFQEAIKNSLPHYFLYPTSKDQWKYFQEEISPFTVENAMKIKAFHAINVIYSKEGYLKPFIAKMTAPPTLNYKNKHA